MNHVAVDLVHLVERAEVEPLARLDELCLARVRVRVPERGERTWMNWAST